MIRFAVAKGKGGGGGVVSLSGLSSSQSLGRTLLYCRAGWKLWLDSQGKPTVVGPAVSAGSFSFTAETQDDPKSQAPHAAPVSLAV